MLSAFQADVLAICVLAAVALWLAASAAVLLHRSPFTVAQSFLYVYNVFLTRILWRVRVSGQLPIPDGQGAVIVCNHRSPIDPTLIVLTTTRVVQWMVAKEYYQHPLLAWFFRTCNAIPVSRGGVDTSATKAAIRSAQNGGLVGLFPEGRINTTDRLLRPARPGAALIALKARVPVVPCYVSGSPYDGTMWGCLLMPAKARLEVGRPIDISRFYGRETEREVLEDLTRQFLVEVARLAGQPDYQPQLAGRFYKPAPPGQ